MSQPSAKETPCPECGEMVRVNSLRCFNCGAFMSAEVEQRYMALQARPSSPVLSEVPANEMSSAEEDDSDVDFELNLPTQRLAAESESEEPKSSDEASSNGASKAAAEGNDIPHSVATGGDALLDIAIQEEREFRKRQKGRRQIGGMRTPGGGLIIFCPYGCRVEVKEHHRGMTGTCPRCGAPFIVPVDPPQFKKPKADAAAASSEKADQFRVWIPDLHLHLLEPEKLKLKADSLLKDFTEADVGFSPEHLVVAVLMKKGVRAAKGSGKPELREQMLAFIKEGKPLDDLPLAEKYIFSSADVSQIKVVQPVARRTENIFHGVPVFGTGRIAIQLPITEKMTHPAYLSMGITEFWSFAKAMEEVYQIAGFGSEAGLPMQPKHATFKCHYTDTLIKALENVELYRADPSVQLEVAGYQCGACKLVVSEVGRKKENLGGKSPKGIAKAKCPKCGSKMGENLLYSLKQDVAQPSMSGEGTSA